MTTQKLDVWPDIPDPLSARERAARDYAMQRIGRGEVTLDDIDRMVQSRRELYLDAYDELYY